VTQFGIISNTLYNRAIKINIVKYVQLAKMLIWKLKYNNDHT